MRIRPLDENGDVLPVLSAGGVLRDAAAVAALIRERLELYLGDWWETPSRGSPALELLRSSRPTEADAPALSRAVSDWLRSTPGVLDLRDISCQARSGAFFYACTAVTEYGDVQVAYTA